jgi:hypothetical protein
MNLRKSILALSVVAGIVAAPMTVFAAHTHSWGSPQYYGYEDEIKFGSLSLPSQVLPSTMDMKMKCLVYMMTGINVRHVMYIITNNV